MNMFLSNHVIRWGHRYFLQVFKSRKILLLGINKSRKVHMALHVHVEKTRSEPLTRALSDSIACNVFCFCSCRENSTWDITTASFRCHRMGRYLSRSTKTRPGTSTLYFP